MMQNTITPGAQARVECETRICPGRFPDTWHALGLRRKLYIWFPNIHDAKPLSRLVGRDQFLA